MSHHIVEVTSTQTKPLFLCAAVKNLDADKPTHYGLKMLPRRLNLLGEKTQDS